MNWTFPKINLKKTEIEQCSKVIEEVQEFESETTQHAKDLEALDIYHAAESLLRIRFKGRTRKLTLLVSEVISKNRARGKYS